MTRIDLNEAANKHLRSLPVFFEFFGIFRDFSEFFGTPPTVLKKCFFGIFQKFSEFFGFFRNFLPWVLGGKAVGKKIGDELLVK